jgi:uncharacterized membrane protein YczE
MRRECLRLVRLIWGLFLYALGVVMTISANLGLSPWDVFHQGLADRLGISFGVASILTSAVIIAAAAAMKESVGFGTFCNMIFIGGFIDMMLFGEWIPKMNAFVSGLAMMTAGLFVIAFGSYFYSGAGYGAGPRDSLMVVAARRAGRPVGLCRACVEGAALFCGWLLGGPAGAGTIIAAFGVGIAVQIVFTLLRFDVKAISHEYFTETYARLKNFLARPKK